MFKVLRIHTFVVFGVLLLCATIVNATGEKQNVVIIDNNSKGYAFKFAERAESDSEDAGALFSKYELNSETTHEFLLDKEEYPVIISESEWQATEGIKTKIHNEVKSGREVFIYGDHLKISEIKQKLGLMRVIDDETKKESFNEQSEQFWNIVGFKNGQINFSGNVSLDDANGQALKPGVDLILQDILRNKEKAKFKPTSKNVEDKRGNEVHSLSYSTDTIVQSSYNNTSTYYANDASGTPILRASLNTDWILKRNTSNDTDPSYDYFYVRDNAELYTNTAKGTNGYGIHTEHTLPWAGSDNVLDWGPDATSNISNVTVAIPWGVEWQFTVGDSLDISASGSQTTDSVTWDVTNYSWNGLRYNFSGDYNRLQPGTAWASSGTYAGINVKNIASFYYGSTYKELSQTFNVRYDYQ